MAFETKNELESNTFTTADEIAEGSFTVKTSEAEE